MKLNITNSLIIISIIFTIISFQKEDILFFWMNNYFLNSWEYFELFLQFCFYSFIHGSIMHLAFNSLFLYIFWNQVEEILWSKKYLIFFVLNTIFVWISILIFSKANTVWISWFGMALISFYTFYLYRKKDSEYKWWITAIIINIIIWFSPTISLVWHLFWAIFGLIYFIIYKIWK